MKFAWLCHDPSHEEAKDVMESAMGTLSIIAMWARMRFDYTIAQRSCRWGADAAVHLRCEMVEDADAVL